MRRYVIVETNNYGKFIINEFNRDVVRKKKLKASMEKYGFHPGFPIIVVRVGERLKIIDGHHRFMVARELGITVFFLEFKEDEVPSMHELEGGKVPWSIGDYVTSFARCDKKPFVNLLEYHKATGIALSNAASMLMGQSAGSANYQEAIKEGTFKLGNQEHADVVADIVIHCKTKGVQWASHGLFVQAISKISRARDFDAEVLKQKISRFHSFMEKQPNLERYMDMLDDIYNRQSRMKIPLKFQAEQAMRERQLSGMK